MKRLTNEELETAFNSDPNWDQGLQAIQDAVLERAAAHVEQFGSDLLDDLDCKRAFKRNTSTRKHCADAIRAMKETK